MVEFNISWPGKTCFALGFAIYLIYRVKMASQLRTVEVVYGSGLSWKLKTVFCLNVKLFIICKYIWLLSLTEEILHLKWKDILSMESIFFSTILSETFYCLNFPSVKVNLTFESHAILQVNFRFLPLLQI